MKTAVFAAAWIALYTGHHVADFWLQTASQARRKDLPGWAGHAACLQHVLAIAAAGAAALAAISAVTGYWPHPGLAVAGIAVNAVSHYAADRRRPLAALAAILGKASFWQFGQPRPGHDDKHCMGTGQFHLDQSWHIAWLFAAALIITV